MKNILNEMPADILVGRLKYCDIFVEKKDLKDKVILDLGCGYGWYENLAVKRGCKKIVGTELTLTDLKTAKKNVKDKKIDFVVCSALKINFPDNFFDTVVAWDVIEHIPKGTEIVMFKEVARVLKKGGLFYFSTPYNSIASMFFDPAWWLVNHRHYSIKTIKNKVKKTGLSYEKHEIRGGLFTLIGIVNLYVSKWIFRRKPFFESFFSARETMEYQQKKGFVEIFVKLKKA